MKWKKLYRESEEKFDYTTILFPNKDYGEKGKPEIIDIDGYEYVMASAEFDALNSSWLGEMNVNFIYEVEAEGHWRGSYRAATREEPEEYPDFEVTDTWSDVVRIEMSDGETTIDITDRFPTKKQAEKDGNGKWYEEYSNFIKNMGEYAEENAAERLNENPPEDTRYEDYWDDREDWDESSMCSINENSLPMELRNKALAAQRILKNNASLSDSELKSFIRRAKMMHRDELAQAAQDLLEYRNAAQNIDGDWVDRKFTGISSDFDESTEDGGFNIPDSKWKRVNG